MNARYCSSDDRKGRLVYERSQRSSRLPRRYRSAVARGMGVARTLTCDTISRGEEVDMQPLCSLRFLVPFALVFVSVQPAVVFAQQSDPSKAQVPELETPKSL